MQQWGVAGNRGVILLTPGAMVTVSLLLAGQRSSRSSLYIRFIEVKEFRHLFKNDRCPNISADLESDYPAISCPVKLAIMMKSSKFMKLFTLAYILGVAPTEAQQFDPNLGSSGVTWDPANVGTNKSTNATYSNPVMTINVGDPFMTKYTGDDGEWYLFTYTTNDNITLKRSRFLTDNWDQAETRTVFNPDSVEDKGQPWSTSLWAPEIHNISGSWYM